MNRRLLAIFGVFAVAMAILAPMGAAAETTDLSVPASAVPDKGEAVYIIHMAGDPVVAYEGGVAKLKATKPADGKKINPKSKKVRDYVAHLTAVQNDAAASVGATAFYHYAYAFNGFAAKITGQQAAALAARSDVLRVQEDEIRQLQTDNSPGFLDLYEENGLYDMGYDGEDVIVGIIDTGIWPEHPSFSDEVGNTDSPGASNKRNLKYGPPPAGWFGSCQSGERFSQDDCNNKIIGAKYFKDGFTNNEIKISDDYLSARDADGHGSHTAATAAGNAEVSASIFGIDRGTVQGIAPRARVAVYKACWADAGCAGSDLTLAIDTAVADGVDVINYSIGSSAASLGSDDIAFLFAADAGVYVATSNGNGGPGAATTGSPAWDPWVTSVGASTQDRTFQGSASSSDGWEFFGASITGGTDEVKLVDAADATADGDDRCLPGTLDPAVVAGNIVLCRRADIARVAKSLAVHLAGGAGMILYNNFDADSQVTDNHYVPSVHVNNTDGLVIKGYIGSAGDDAKAMINGGTFTSIDAPWMAAFSSRGPNSGALDIIKPDITAPGVNILAAHTPTPFLGSPGETFQAISGTSMSSPHVAGVFALLKQANPSWSASAAKSALMTTAYPEVMKEDGVTPADPFDMGAGHLDPNPAVDPGLVYEAGFFDYLAFLCGNNPGAVGPGTCSFLESLGFSLDPAQLNYPSIGVSALAGEKTVTRTVTNVTPGSVDHTYTVAVDAPPGVAVVVSPPSLTLSEGQSASYEVTFTADGSVVEEWTFGSLTWGHGPHSVRSPIAVRPLAIAAPAELLFTGTDGSASFDVTFGYTGDYTAAPHGLAEGGETVGYVVDDPANNINVALGTGVGITEHTITVPPDTALARFSLFDDFTDGADDLDLYVFLGDDNVGGSGSGTSAEEVNLLFPVAGDYTVIVHGWQTDGPDSNYTLFDFMVPVTPGGGSLSIDSAPAAATLAVTEAIDISWTGLSASKKYLGAVSHNDGPFPSLIGLTLIGVDTY